ncbi:uncharacterized protein LOC113383680 [Ctenocephalides felis]|uniref:uncharacterized protein LOC113383680 n=1 Tax=Ctenocephalides felis TaxID=7515 RepID=UPI000E6E3DDD|nr:uncharacterized protein LOC113383680 [Ctenocephalides felis]
MNLEYALLQKAIKLQEKEVLLKNKEKMMEKWIRDNFPKRSINYSKYDNNDRNNIKNSRIPSPTTVYEVKNEPPYPFILPTRELFHSPNIDKKGGGLGDYKHFTAELYQQHDIAFNNNNEENLKKLEDYHKYLDSLTHQQGEEVYITEVNKPNHNNYPIFSSYYDSKPSVDNSKNYFHKAHTSHIQEPFKHGDIDIKEKHKAAIWKDISHILTALVPIGILISALKPNVLRVDSNSTNMRPTIMPTMMPLRYRYIEQFVNSFKNENFEKDFTKSFKNKSACELYELCILATSDSDTKFDDGQKIIYRQLLRAVKSTPVQTLEMLGLKELFDNIKNNSCNRYQCNQYQINKN